MNTQAVNRTSAVIAAVCITFISVGSFLILPLLVGAAADDMGLTERQVGFLASAGMAGAALSSALAVFWIRRVDWRRAGYLSVGVLLAALFMTTGSFIAVLVLAAGAVIVSFLMFAFAVERRSRVATVANT